jgi:hypothetical protein
MDISCCKPIAKTVSFVRKCFLETLQFYLLVILCNKLKKLVFQRSLAALDNGKLTESNRLGFQNILHQTINKMAAKRDKHEAIFQVWP